MAEKPVLLLDIDGVLNLFPRSYGLTPTDLVTRQTNRHRVRLYDDDDPMEPTYTLNVPGDLPALVGQLIDHFDIHWYTMWNSAAVDVFAPLVGLPAFPYFKCDWVKGREVFDGPEWMRKYIWIAKTPLIPEHVGTRPFCWIDDDTNEVDIMWLEGRPAIGSFRIITVEPHSGLTQTVVDEAVEWARSLTITEEIAS